MRIIPAPVWELVYLGEVEEQARTEAERPIRKLILI